MSRSPEGLGELEQGTRASLSPFQQLAPGWVALLVWRKVACQLCLAAPGLLDYSSSEASQVRLVAVNSGERRCHGEGDASLPCLGGGAAKEAPGPIWPRSIGFQDSPRQKGDS